MWAIDGVAEELRYASPALAEQVNTLCKEGDAAPRDIRRAALSVARYMLRAGKRATPFGYFAGVTPARFDAVARVRWGLEHRAVVTASAEWLVEAIAHLEACPELLLRLSVVSGTTLMVRGDRLIVPYLPASREGGVGAVEVSLRNTAPVQAAVTAARVPILVEDLAAKLGAEFPEAAPETVMGLLAELVSRRVLVTCLHAPATETDALGHLLKHLDAAGVPSVAPISALVAEMRDIHSGLANCSAAPVVESRAAREEVARRMTAVVPVRRHPLAVDLRLDAKVILPQEVARETERAALALARLSPAPYGTTVWKAYHQRFYERFGIGSLVPLLDVVADSGIGFPDGYPGSPAAERRPPTERDEALLRLVQDAVLDGRDEIALDDVLISSLERGPSPVRLPPHLEVAVRVHAASVTGLQRGDFRLEVGSVSRGAGVGIGRFLNVVTGAGRASLITELSDLPGGDDTTVAAQLSFPPLDPTTAHIARSPRVLPLVISLDEHRDLARDVLTVEDLAVGCDGRRMYLAAPTLGHRVEAVGMHALSLRVHTPPLARFLTELSRAQCATVSTFDWGAARSLPFLPRLRYGRTVLSPARWRLRPEELPLSSVRFSTWDRSLSGWLTSRRVPSRVYLTQGDRMLALDLDLPGHRVLLRAHLDRGKAAVLTEAPQQWGWCAGRAHEVVIPLKATAPPAWPRLPQPTRARVIGRDHGQRPAASPVLLACLYGDIRRQDTILADYLPALLEQLGQPRWWFVRFRDPDHHLRLRIDLPDPDTFGETARVVSAWAGSLHQAGLLREVRYPTSYPETGRWGSRAAWAAAEEVFRADSRAVLAQARQSSGLDHRALIAAHSVAIAVHFLGSPAKGMRWLIDHIPSTAPATVPRSVFSEAVRLADPSQDWAALRATPRGSPIVEAWADREMNLSAYRAHVPGPDTEGIDADHVLTSLLHMHFIRAVGIDFAEEDICRYLARAAALAWTARGGAA
ncbi:lantibiotic dehydratase [Streptomyces sp. NPDC127084]|uniref:lantibiotic dehydratase n=1 Tax=Streptomyces sp. NPDC127084 TaxID=3347133 RepID=UPI003669C987